MKPFDFVKNILTEKEPLTKLQVKASYPSFYVNSVLYEHFQNIYLLQAMNKYPFLDKIAQYMFFFYGCEKMWKIPYQKTEKVEKVKNDAIMDKLKKVFPDYSEKRLLEIMPLMKDKLGVIK